ncbi:MAG: rhomboid family intramembrane serine protease [Pseudomonadales bacterium]|nr:rhomboid family intramembrane serine protease [Pseudomonadales bacterium]
MIKAASLSLDIDLLSYSHFLRQQGLKHRIVEESGVQSIYVEGDREAAFIKESLQSYLDGRELLEQQRVTTSHSSNQAQQYLYKFLSAFIQSPVTISLVLISIVVAIVTSLGSEVSRLSFLFYPLIATSSLGALITDITSFEIAAGTLTPMFLHFGELHLVFNMLWLWYFGRQLEAIQPIWMFLLLVVITSFVSNTTQYLAIEFNNFGGMSGVVYGLVGYTWVIHSLMARSYLLINTNMFVFFVVALVLMEIVASSWIATAAHVGGLVSGLVIGLLTVFYYRVILKREVVGRSR